MKPSVRFESRWDAVAAGLFAVGFLSMAAIFLYQPLHDPDFWWHLKTGELIVKAKALLPLDPFGLPHEVATFRERVVLDGYWLWQVIAYGFYQAGGLVGIKAFNLVTLLLTYGVLGFHLWRSRVRLTVALPLLLLSLVVYQRFFPLERPQVASFLLAAVLVGMFAAIRRGSRPSPWLYPMMVLWGNLHGGVIIGVLLLGLFAAGYCWEERGCGLRIRGMVLWCAGGTAAALLNPNGIDNLLALWRMGSQESLWTVTEFRSTFTAFALDRRIALVWLLLALHFAGLWRGGARFNRAGDWLVSLFVALIAVKYMRNVAFAAVALVPMSGHYLEQAMATASPRVRGGWQKVQLLAAGAMLVYVVTMAQWVMNARRFGLIDPEFPRELTGFLKSLPLSGTILNDYRWGGYLIWELHPQYRIVVDGRVIDPQVLEDYQSIIEASQEPLAGRPTYEVLMEKYGFDVVLMSTEVGYTGINELLKYLLNRPEWQPVYLSGQGCVLLKRNDANAAIVQQYRIDKLAFLKRLVALYDDYLRRYPDDYRRYFGRGDLLGYMGRYEEAARDFAMVRQLDPNNPFLPAKLRELEKLRGQGAAR